MPRLSAAGISGLQVGEDVNDAITSARLHHLLATLLAHHGPLDWWPAQRPFEIWIGAVLTQNTAWSNVEKALTALREEGLIDAQAILAADPARLAAAIRPAGYYNVKAERLRNLCHAYEAGGGSEGLRRLPTATLRERLLAIKGVGRETADDILLYAFNRPVFVVDAYTRRLFSRLGWIAGDERYEVLRACVEAALGADTSAFNELHAQIVALGKTTCRPRPRCRACPLSAVCAAAAVGDAADAQSR